MKFEWSPGLGPLNGAFVFLSASVPDTGRDRRFLAGPANDDLMLRVIDQRVDSAVKSLLFQTLAAGGRIVHGGHPKIILAIMHQANQWKGASTDAEPPVRIYQSEYFRKHKAPPGRDEMERAKTGKVRWVPTKLSDIKERWPIPDELIERQIAAQAAPNATPELREALFAMRLAMLLEAQPRSAVCIGGMEGIEAEARLYLELAKLNLIPYAEHVHVIGSTYGAAAQLSGDGIFLADRTHFDPSDVVDTTTPENSAIDPAAAALGARFEGDSMQGLGGGSELPPLPVAPATPEAALEDLQRRISYYGTMRSLVRSMAPGNN